MLASLFTSSAVARNFVRRPPSLAASSVHGRSTRSFSLCPPHLRSVVAHRTFARKGNAATSCCSSSIHRSIHSNSGKETPRSTLLFASVKLTWCNPRSISVLYHGGIKRPAPGTGYVLKSIILWQRRHSSLIDCRIKIHFKDSKGNDLKTIEANEGDDILSIAHEHDIDLEGTLRLTSPGQKWISDPDFLGHYSLRCL